MSFEPKNRKVELNCDGYRSQDWTGQQEYNFHLLQVFLQKRFGGSGLGFLDEALAEMDWESECK